MGEKKGTCSTGQRDIVKKGKENLFFIVRSLVFFNIRSLLELKENSNFRENIEHKKYVTMQ